MWDSDAKSNACAHGCLPLFDRLANGITMFRFYCASLSESGQQLVYRLPAVRRLQGSDDLIFSQDVTDARIHKFEW